MLQADTFAPFEKIVEMRGVKGVFEIGNDGFLLRALQSGTGDPDSIAASTAVAIRSWKQIGSYMRLGTLDWIMLEYEQGTIIIKSLKSTIIVIIGSQHMVSGEVLLTLQSSNPINDKKN